MNGSEPETVSVVTADRNLARHTRVDANSPTAAAGVHTGDEILAINGFWLKDDIESRLR